jgi:hypothetical protein
MTPASPTLAASMRRFEAARTAARDLVAGLSEDAFHETPPAGGWSVSRCLEHLVVADGRILERLEAAIARSRAEGRLAAPDVAHAPVRLSWFDRLFVAATAPGRDGAPPRMKTSVRPAFDPGDPRARGRTRDQVLADFLARQDRLDAAAVAADGLDLAGIKVASVLADWIRVSLGGWFVAIAGHQERHLDQARRARAAIEGPVHTGVGGP